ncbi:hypothetical protein SynBMKMC1_01709 [Synechococcus sp. BMK-MC-1]|nr:hypothetical protein SynBMKMC1_01709 [Synechococcus sp. BMK-MC-1]
MGFFYCFLAIVVRLSLHEGGRLYSLLLKPKSQTLFFF